MGLRHPVSTLCLFLCVTWRIHTCDMTHSYVRQDSFICATGLNYMCTQDSFICVLSRPRTCIDAWLISMCDVTYFCDVTNFYVWCDSLICVTSLVYMRDMTHLFMRHDSSKGLSRPRTSMDALLIYMCDITHLYARHDPSIYATWLIYVCVVEAEDLYGRFAHLHVWQDSYICVRRLICTCHLTYFYACCSDWELVLMLGSFLCVIWLIHTCDMTVSWVWHDSSMLIERTPPPGGVSYLLCSLIKNRE